MTADQIIAIIGDIASFVAAAAAMAAAWGTFLTVRQIQKQTATSYRGGRVYLNSVSPPISGTAAGSFTLSLLGCRAGWG
jgi:hypothetical protein